MSFCAVQVKIQEKPPESVTPEISFDDSQWSNWLLIFPEGFVLAYTLTTVFIQYTGSP